MKIEKISDVQIKATLSHSDLLDRDLKISELAYGSAKAQELFQDMMVQAHEEFGFEAENVPLMIEAVPLSTDSIMIVVTKVDDPEQIEKRLEKIGERPTHRSFKNPDEDKDEFLELVGDDEPEEIVEGSKMTYLFNSFEQACMAAHSVQPLFSGDNSLYKYQDRYFMILGANKKAHTENSSIKSLLTEFGVKLPVSDLNESFLEEHGTVIVKANAIEILNKYL